MVDSSCTAFGRIEDLGGLSRAREEGKLGNNNIPMVQVGDNIFALLCSLEIC